MNKLNKYGEEIWVRDLSPNFLTAGELDNEDAINSMLENVIMTLPMERPFNYVGSELQNKVFDNISQMGATSYTNLIAQAIAKFIPLIDITSTEIKTIISAKRKAVYITVKWVTKNYNSGEYMTKAEVFK